MLLAAVAVAILSLGYDLTKPLLAGIVTDLSAPRGLAMGLNVFTLFVGFGLGSLLFQALLKAGFGVALVVFGVATLVAAGPGHTRLPRRDPRSDLRLMKAVPVVEDGGGAPNANGSHACPAPTPTSGLSSTVSAA